MNIYAIVWLDYPTNDHMCRFYPSRKAVMAARREIAGRVAGDAKFAVWKCVLPRPTRDFVAKLMNCPLWEMPPGVKPYLLCTVRGNRH